MTRFLAVVMIVLCAAVVGWLNQDRIAAFLDDGASPAPTTTSAPAQLAAAPEPRYRFALIDPTTSTDTSFRTAMKADLIAAVTGYLPDKPADPSVGAPEVIGLELTVKLVGTDSLAYGQQTVQVSIPSVAALPARPDLTAEGVLDPDGPYDIWQASAETWSGDYDAAVEAVTTSLAALEGIDLDRDEFSGITAGAAALALLAPVDGDVAFAVFSDLDENRTTQPAQFNGHPILAVQPDNVGDIGRWQALFDRFSSWATANGAGDITRVRPEAAASAITTFITES